MSSLNANNVDITFSIILSVDSVMD